MKDVGLDVPLVWCPSSMMMELQYSHPKWKMCSSNLRSNLKIFFTPQILVSNSFWDFKMFFDVKILGTKSFFINKFQLPKYFWDPKFVLNQKWGKNWLSPTNLSDLIKFLETKKIFLTIINFESKIAFNQKIVYT